MLGNNARQAGKHLNVPNKARATTLPYIRKTSDPSGELSMSTKSLPAEISTSATIRSVSGVLFALKHWICKHFFVSMELRQVV